MNDLAFECSEKIILVLYRKYILGIVILVPRSGTVTIQGKDKNTNKGNLCIVCVATCKNITMDISGVIVLLPSPLWISDLEPAFKLTTFLMGYPRNR